MNAIESYFEILHFFSNLIESSEKNQFYIELSTFNELWLAREMRGAIDFANSHSILSSSRQLLNMIDGSLLDNDDRYSIKKGKVYDSFFSESERELTYQYRNGIMKLLIDEYKVGVITFQIESTNYFDELLSHPRIRRGSRFFNDNKSAIAHYNNHKLYSKVLSHFFIEANRNEVMVTDHVAINPRQHFELLSSLPTQ